MVRLSAVFLAALFTPSLLVGGVKDTSSSVVWHIDNLSSIGGYPVSVAGNPVVKETDIGKAMEFDGIDDGLIVHGCPLNGCSSFTMEILFKPYASFPNNIEQRFLHMQNPALGSRRALLELRLTGENTWFVDTHIRADSAFLTLLATHLPHPVGPWYHLALVYENGVGKHYVNGVEEMSGRVPYIPVENADVSIGMRMNRVWYFKGAIRAVSMSRHALRPGGFKLSSPTTMIDGRVSAQQLLFADDFSSGSSSWIAEFENPSGSSLSVWNGTLDISASAGATVWLKKKLSGNVMISYDVTVVDSGGKNDRVSDMNAFWMASDPSRPDTVARDLSRGMPFTRDGTFSSYDNLDLYYAGVGGHDNTTTRFRKYRAGGGKPVLQEYTDTEHLLEGNRVYSVAIAVRNGRTSYSLNGVRFFDFADASPLTEGYFGFRTTRSHQRVSNFKIHRPASSLTKEPDRVVVYKTVGGVDLSLHIFNPPDSMSAGKKPAIVLFHGGGWNDGNPGSLFRQCAYLASRGMVAISAQYRVRNTNGTTPRECVMDGKSAMRWVRRHAAELGIDPDRLAAGGGSAGGQVAAAAAMVRGFNEESDDTTISCRPDALVLFNPVIDNGPEGYGYARVKEYWKEFSPMHNLNERAPPTLFMVGTVDDLIPVATAEKYRDRMQELGRRCELRLYPGEKHAFYHKAGFLPTLRDTDAFLVSLGYLRGGFVPPENLE